MIIVAGAPFLNSHPFPPCRHRRRLPPWRRPLGAVHATSGAVAEPLGRCGWPRLFSGTENMWGSSWALYGTTKHAPRWDRLASTLCAIYVVSYRDKGDIMRYNEQALSEFKDDEPDKEWVDQIWRPDLKMITAQFHQVILETTWNLPGNGNIVV